MSQFYWSEVLDPDLCCSQQDADLCFPKRSRREDEVRALTYTSNSSLKRDGWPLTTSKDPMSFSEQFSTLQNLRGRSQRCAHDSLAHCQPWSFSAHQPTFHGKRCEKNMVPRTTFPSFVPWQIPVWESLHQSVPFRNPCPRASQWFNAKIFQTREAFILLISITKHTPSEKLPAPAASYSSVSRILIFFKKRC